MRRRWFLIFKNEIRTVQDDTVIRVVTFIRKKLINQQSNYPNVFRREIVGALDLDNLSDLFSSYSELYVCENDELTNTKSISRNKWNLPQVVNISEIRR